MQFSGSSKTPQIRASSRMDFETAPARPSHGGKKRWPRMTPEEEDLITRLHHLLGDRWDLIAKRLPDRSAEEVESYWKMKERGECEENKIYKPVCTRLSPSFKFIMDELLENKKPSQTGS